MPGASCQSVCVLWWVLLVREGGKIGASGPNCVACCWPAEGRGTWCDTRGRCRTQRARSRPLGHLAGPAGVGARLKCSFPKHCDVSNFQVLVQPVWEVRHRVLFRNSSSVGCPRLVQLQGVFRQMEGPQGMQEGGGAAAVGSGRPLALQKKLVAHGQGPARRTRGVLRA